jgi:hypothetical protein
MDCFVGNICEIIIAITAVLGVCVSITTWKKNTQLEQKKIVQDFFRESFEDKDFATIFHSIDYDKNFYGPDFHDSELEAKLDKFLIRYTFCVGFVAGSNPNDKNMDWIKYEIHRILTNFSIQSYLFNLCNFTKRINAPFPYKSLVDYGKSAGLLDETFFNAERGVKKYGKTLNW